MMQIGAAKIGSAWLTVVLAIAAAAGCGGDEQPAPAAPGCTEVAGACVGVPAEAVCGGNTCTDGVVCATILTAASDAELDDAIAQAGAGDCIALEPGSYQRAELPGGVSLLGRGAHAVTVAGVGLGDGDGAWVRGLTVTDTLDVGTAVGVHVAAVRVSGGQNGLVAGPGSVVSIEHSELSDAAHYGLLGIAAASISLSTSVIRGAGHGGLQVQCAADATALPDPCDCTTKPEVSIEQVLLRQNSGVSAAFIGSAATLRSVDIDEVQSGPSFSLGGGVAAAACSSLLAETVHITVAALDDGQGMSSPQGYGVLVDSSSAVLGTGGDEKGIIVVDGMPGVWINAIGAPAQEPDQHVRIEGASLESCRGAALGFDGAAKGIIVVDGKVAHTAIGAMPSEVTGTNTAGAPADLGLGVIWKGGATASIDGLSLSGSAGLAMLIDGETGTGSSLANVSLSGGDEVGGIVQQQMAPDHAPETTPASDGSMGAIEVTADKVSEVPVGPTVPAPE